MLTDYGHIKIIDFDAARVKKPEAEKDTSFIGTDGFAPPEQYGFMQTDERSDIYALGVTIKLLLKENYDSSFLRAVAEKCMRFNPDERYSSAQKVKHAVILRRYHAVPIACAAVITVVGIVLAVTFMFSRTDAIPVSETTEQTVGIITDATAETTTVPQTSEITTAEQTVITTAFAKITTTPQTTEMTTAEDTANPEIPFLPKGFPALPDGVTKVDDTEHVKKIEWEKLAQDDASALIDNITKWLGETAKVDDRSTRMGRTIQWKCSNNTFSGYIILLYVEDTEKYSAFPQCRISIAENK